MTSCIPKTLIRLNLFLEGNETDFILLILIVYSG
jgi:hypothetical protein